MYNKEIRTLDVTRYMVPLREGGSMPAIVEGSDDGLYVLKFRGAGQGVKALVAELIGGELARHIGLNVPEIVFMNLDDSFAKLEPDEEVQDLLKFSVGLNMGLYFLTEAITYDPLVSIADAFSASKIVLLDSILTNIDRTARNTNLLNWHDELWLIDHGACLYFHHAIKGWEQKSQRNFPPIKDHVLLERATMLDQAAVFFKATIKPSDIEGIVSLIPDDWLEDNDYTPEERRQIYVSFLNQRLSILDQLLAEVKTARDALI